MTAKKKKPTKSKEADTEYTNSAVARLRVITGMTQVEFAKRCAINLRSYKSLEKRQHEKGTGLSRQHAFQIAAATGASAAYLMRNQLRSTEMNHEKYTRKYFERMMGSYNFITDDWKKDLSFAVTERFDDIVESVQKSAGHRFLPALLALASQIDALAEKHGVTQNKDGEPLKPCIHAIISTARSEIQNPKEGRFAEYSAITDVAAFLEKMLIAEDAARNERKMHPKDRVPKTRRMQKTEKK